MKGKLILTVEEAQDKAKWEALRKEGVGGSDVAAIMGYSNYKSAYSLWAEKTGQVEAEDISDKEFVIWGNKNEPNIADRFEEVTGKKVRRCGTLADEEYPFLHANIDRWVVGENAGLEIKTAGLTKSKAWKDDEIPNDYYIQCVYYMAITGADYWYIAVLIGGNDFKWKRIERNEDDIKAVREVAINFWQYNVQGGVAPEVDGNEGTSETIKKQYEQEIGTEIALPSQAADLLARWDELKATKALVDLQLAEIQNSLCVLLGDAKKGVIGNRTVTWGNQAGRVTLDTKALKAAYPDIYNQFAKVGKPSRRFGVK